ncbi:histidine kinase [uncultured Aquimonas sp.]|uniref:sensor histidine kinase n=1 Tax=uncultured Aquimonas sp. TaxID=385483 RepID=UPI000B2C13EF|nr:histidine kinase [uncultured Aquimonas sp.]
MAPAIVHPMLGSAAVLGRPSPCAILHTLAMISRPFLLAAAGFWLLFGLVAGIQVWISMITHGHNIALLLGFHVAVWIVWLAPTVGIVWLARRFPMTPPRALSFGVHFLAATVIGLLHALYSLGLMLWLQPYDAMTASAADIQLEQALLTPLLLEWILYLLVLGAVLALDYGRRSREQAAEAEELRRSLVDARLHALELQLRPHFLFNTLNAITGLVRTGRGDEAIGVVAGLGDLLRYSLDHAGRQRVRLDEEVEMLTRFLEIHRARFPDRMTFEVSLPPPLTQAAVPILILQPLVENAVRHGVERLSGAHRIEVAALLVGNGLQLQVANRGQLASPVSEGIGLRNTRERLRALYGDQAGFALTQAGEQVIARVELPFESLA